VDRDLTERLRAYECNERCLCDEAADKIDGLGLEHQFACQEIAVAHDEIKRLRAGENNRDELILTLIGERDDLRAQLASASERGDQYHAENDELFRRAVSAEMQLASARKALEPFTRHYESWMERLGDDDKMSVFPRHTMGELRAAKTALTDD